MPKLHMALDDKVGDREIFIASLMVQYHFDTARAADSVAGEVLMCNMILGTWRGVCQQGGGPFAGVVPG